ncbi:syncytin-A-like isoform X1 [Corapipo altera]|uniref:syncytin-A-like isoform X1 n=1 Tax=Corapipo altera TaxID=415028 RepID=UPI000FD6445F|nr:syncytin-A-like isoform X1 [Corapipo altera]
MKGIIALFVLLASGTTSWLTKIDQRQNMWITWANQTNLTSFCLSLATPSDPFRTCLLGVPFQSYTDLLVMRGWISPEVPMPHNESQFIIQHCHYAASLSNNKSTWGNKTWCQIQIKLKSENGLALYQWGLALWTRKIVMNLNRAGLEPQELELLGSKPGNYCVVFGDLYDNPEHKHPLNNSVIVTPSNVEIYNYKIGSPYCINGIDFVFELNKSPRRLPPATFLVCGDRAWNGIPANPWGGPCWLGKLTLFSPQLRDLQNVTRSPKRQKRSITIMDQNCNSHLLLWNSPIQILASIFAPHVSAAHALRQITRLACWAGKQLNITSDIIGQLTLDVDSVRHAVLQNRAAIDFLLLAHGHGCEEFEGMCCFNLSDHSESIHKKLQKLQDGMHDLLINSNPFDGWLCSWGIGNWLRNIIIALAGPFIIIVLCLCCGPCLLQCLLSQIHKVMDTLFEKRGGDVGGRGLRTIESVYSRV